MDKIDFSTEAWRALIAAIVAFFAAAALKALGAGKWAVAAGSGAVGGLAAVAAIA
jgi:uncharacterized membrane protein YjjP (DUF1212 family)